MPTFRDQMRTLSLALAERMQRPLITADRRLIRTLAKTEHAGTAIGLSDLNPAEQT